MNRRSIAWIVIAVVGVLSAAGMFWSIFVSSKVTFSEAELESRLNQQLPRTIKDVTITHVVVKVGDNRLALRIDMNGTVLRQPVSAVVSARGVPRYDERSGAMYFDADEVRINQLTVAGKAIVTDADAAAHSRLTDAVTPTIQRLTEAAAKAYLAARPVYRLKNNATGFVLKAALSGVTIEENALVVTFSLWNLTITVGIFATLAAAILVPVYLLIRHPLWGLGVLADVATVDHLAEIPVVLGVNVVGKLLSKDRKADQDRKSTTRPSS
jgi:Protein of unknown function (DUF1439)